MTYELHKYFILEYDESKANNGIGNHLTVTQYTEVSVNLGTAASGRGQRGIEIDAKEFMALRNIIHFNCLNPFGCNSCKQQPPKTGRERLNSSFLQGSTGH